MIKKNTFKVLIAAILQFKVQAVLAGAVEDLEAYGSFIVNSVEERALGFQEVMHTMTTPLNTYVVKFTTSHDALLSAPNADKDKAAQLENLGKTMVWETKFCTTKLVSIMRRNGIDAVFGQIFSASGEIQRIASCYPRNA
ncbi:MAG: hypothetical protein IPN63_01325 [Gammaproteobacteria bacterium]|nr:hypothetical protein [Gammaproteobacteria bacterium]MBK9426088.1 hypothetical protein [Gammaproteobacteria bacterium]